MQQRERVYSVLLACASDKFSGAMTALLPPPLYDPPVCVSDGNTARQKLLERGFDLVILSDPLPDGSAVRLALDVCENSGSGVLLFVGADAYPDVSGRLTAAGVLVLQKPATPAAVRQSLTLLCATRERLRRLEERAATMQEKMEEIRLVNRAKWLLIDQLRMTEAQAHRYIEKQAMDRCISRRAVAENILAVYK